MRLSEYTALQIKTKIISREIRPIDLTEHFINRIKNIDTDVQAYLTINEEDAIKRATQLEKKIENSGNIGLLAGVPIAVKDNICTKGLSTTCASKILKNFIPPYDAFVIKRLKEEDAIILGKTNLDEFAMGSSTENSAYKITRNPWNSEYVPGGSSGGSAAAVAADLSVMALGSDTGGSVRQPAALCGVVGIKPTYGRVSRFGLIAFGSSLDQIGTFTRDVKDAALLLEVIAGHDSHDSTSLPEPVPDYLREIDSGVRGVRIGIPKEYFADGLNRDVHNALKGALKRYEQLGAKIIDVSLPHTEYAVAVYYIVANAEASSNLARYDGVRYGYRASKPHGIVDLYCRTRSEGFGTEVKRRIMLGNYALSSGYYDAYYLKASKVRSLIKNDFDVAFQTVDCIICPTSPVPGFKIGERAKNPLEMYLSDIYTIPANLAGIPGISLPCGFSQEGLPIGMQILGKHLEEKKLLQIAYAFERETDFHTKKPVLKSSSEQSR
ncbi:MAG: Asp-tRNA(Asn)/Glu-tRNA(Gln) amidotransferase GatCAB subunit A [Candidatus Brocadia sp.]|nr:Glutamyl-tRNA(Gln) amidotransferase subunit A [Candidatus Brocadia fulgida]MCC6325593.1 Asp-tRNA(Asn)/Glu-tRNA(Gln) amidotransferase subunit GatA [Candidatus Brocadia sp.]MCE7912517.1 Asp-tRNA(Asn)/Glu-tRNA(Gln) amidotransferase subunit GatA [Candidatus Brocadia sp. AMX3]OQZ01017.1 MAG: aspartyl/glutamyl-tRNA amidotransferase subunit A [Candidatus Brocadia sp. UTAMX2]MDG5996750.1 Asp-tRNA(Asn)/Glu-tRNA(Gln) amidotransferase subunit GatA [Candidatus Brocadia sp.]